MTARVALRFQVGARTLATIPRRLVRVGLTLDAVLAGVVPSLPPAGAADGYLVTSLPEALADAVADAGAKGGLIRHVRQRYTRYHTDLTIGEAAWLVQMSGNARAALRRKQRRWTEAAGVIDLRAYRTPDEIAAFHALARPLSMRTYQERLLGAGLPEAAHGFVVAAGEDRVRAWLLFRDDRPVAYLCCTAEGSALRYDHVGHDPALCDLSPGTVLHAGAMRALFADRFARFDFTEGEGQHKRQFATGGTPCLDLLLLRPTLANRAALGALGTFDAAMARAKRWAGRPALRGLAKRVRRAG